MLMYGLLNSLYGQLVFSFNFRGSGQAVQIVKRHHFASYLKRMSVVVRVQEEFLAFVKVCWLLFCLFMSLHFELIKIPHFIIIDPYVIWKLSNKKKKLFGSS